MSKLLRFKPVAAEELQRCRAAIDAAYPFDSDPSTWPKLQDLCAREGFDIKLARWVFQQVLEDRTKGLL